MKNLVCFAGTLSIFVSAGFAWECPPGCAQGGDPVPPVVNPTPVIIEPTAPQGPTFLQVIQQQQQIQNINFPPYLQANPTINPLDQRSGLTNNAIKVINLNPISIGITTVNVPNIINSSLLAPSNIIVSNISTPIPTTTNVNRFLVPSITIAPNPSTAILNTAPVPNTTVTSITTTTTTVNAASPRPDFSGLSNLLNNLSANQKTVSGSGTEKTQIDQTKNGVLDAYTKKLEGAIDQSKKDLVTVIDQFGKAIDSATQQISTANGSKITTTATSSGDKLVTTVKSSINTQNVTPAASIPATTPPAEKDFVSKLTDDFMNFPSSGTPQERRNVLQDMVKTLTNAQKLGLIPANAKDDLSKLVTIANDPNNPAYKSNDTTTIKFYLSSVLSKTSTVVEGTNKTLLTATAINAVTDPKTDVGKTLSTIDNTMQAMQDRTNSLSTVSETQGKVGDRVTVNKDMQKLQAQIDAMQAQVSKADTTSKQSSFDKAVSTVTSAIAEVIPSLVAPGAAKASAVKVVSTATTTSTPGAAPKAGVAQAAPAQTANSPNATVKSTSNGNVPPSIPTVDMTALQNTLNVQTNALGDINSKLETRLNSLSAVNNAIKNFVPTSTNKGQLDMYKSQQQKLTAEIGTLKSDKGMAESKMLTTFSQMYGAAAATNLSKAMANANMNTAALQAAANGAKP